MLDIVANNIRKLQSSIYNFDMKTMLPSEWAEKNLILGSESKFSGYLSFDKSPHTREILDNMRPNSGVEITALMKCSQSAGTQTVVIPAMAYHIAESPTNVMFLSSSEIMVQNTIRGRFDTIMESSGLSGLLKTQQTKKANQRTGDTDKKKEYAGGTMINCTYNPTNLRFHSVEVILADEFDDAPRIDKKEGAILDLIFARTKSYADTRRMLFVSSPTTKGISNIEQVWEMGDKRQWNWKCLHCKTYIPILWRVPKSDGSFGGIKWELDNNFDLIRSSVHYECQNCGGKIEFKDKYKLNLKGEWIPTCKPKNPRYRSYQFNALCNPPGFESWTSLVEQYLKACPPNNGKIDTDALKTFVNIQLGELWEERGKTPRSTELMKNQRYYRVGTVPDKTISEDGNGKVALITMACDLAGIMDLENNIEDVRLDWEIVAHTSKGQTYSINHGSIGTFKRVANKTKMDILNDADRVKWTYRHGVKNAKGDSISVWDRLDEIMRTPLEGESGDYYDISTIGIDMGNSFGDSDNISKYAENFVNSIKDKLVFGIKGSGEENFKKMDQNNVLITKSKTKGEFYYHIDVNQVKDIVSSNMALKPSTDGTQPDGFMNFPQSSDGKYAYNTFFVQYESERRILDTKSGSYTWKKKSENNHFWDISIYNYALREIYISDLRSFDKKHKDLTWEKFCYIINQ